MVDDSNTGNTGLDNQVETFSRRTYTTQRWAQKPVVLTAQATV